MKTDTPKTIYLKDYQRPDYKVETIDLTFDLHETQTHVTSEMQFKLAADKTPEMIFLNGEELKLISVSIFLRKMKAIKLLKKDLRFLILQPILN